MEYSHTKRFSDEEKEGKLGCYDCLRNGEFEFWHDTEFGFLDEKGFTRIYTHNIEHPPQLESILTELKRTPPIVTYQPDVWLTHCNDFMVYTGTWDPLDFYKNSPTGDGRDLFIETTDSDISHLWDESLQEGQTLLEEWYATYYVFQCRHCSKLRGHWDCD